MAKAETPVLTFDENMTAEEIQSVFDEAKSELHGMVVEALGGNRFGVPSKSDFEGREYIESASLKTIGNFLIKKYEDEFRHLVDANIVYLWKEKGGESGGMATLGKCIRPTGLIAHFASDEDVMSKVDYVIWAAADHLRNNQASIRTVHALIFHELLHTHWEDGKLIVVSHEFEGFAREIEEFGMWRNSIKRIAEACETVKDVQQGLFTNVG